MKITQLRAENVKRIEAVDITPDGNVVLIGGDNGQGKTSVLDSIEMALAGKGAVPSVPIRRGADSARIVVETDDLIVTRKFTSGGGSYLDVRNREGMKFSSPQAVLDQLSNSLAFDPVAFMQMKPTEQAGELRRVAGIDTSELDSDYKSVYDDRRDTNRSLKELEAQLASIPHHEGIEGEISVSELVNEHARVLGLYQQLKKSSADEVAASARVARLEAELETAREDARKAEAVAEADADALAKEPRALDQIQAELEGAEERNRKAAENRAHATLSETVRARRAKSEQLTAEIEKITQAKDEMLSSAQFPIDGLSIGEDGAPTYNDIPLSQSSAAEQLRVSVAIAASMNPRLRVMLVRDGSLLDENSMRILAEMAAERDLQVWVERVGNGDEGAVLIHDGNVTSAK